MKNMPDLDIIKEKYHTMVWRMIAIVQFFVWTTKCLLRFFIFQTHLHNQDFFSEPAYIIFFSATILVSFILILFPLQFRIYAYVFFIWAVIHFFEQRSILGITEYIIACLFAYYLGFFKIHIKLKTGVLLSVLLIAIMLQMGFRTLSNGVIVMWYLEFLLTVGIGLSFVMYKSERQKPACEQLSIKKSIVDLSSLGLSSNDIEILQRIAKKEKHKSIAYDYNVSLSTFDRNLRKLFDTIGVENQDEFCTKYSSDKFSAMD
ncbi:MAG: hypothetical protein Ta2F_09830 [Termitinemataceae bacterium]|nr:MAG: hypothetical protein Ta2F_09830 [Termitinemataceae bacterium]